MNLWNRWFGSKRATSRPSRRASLGLESLEARDVMSATPLPVLLVIADGQDFYYKEYADTRNELIKAGVGVAVAATTTNASTPHPDSGQVEAGVSGVVTPDLALADVDASDYSAIAFVGGWGSSMYQYAYNDPNGDGVTDNFYWNSAYNGDDDLNDGVIAPQKVIVNQLINDFLDADKPVAAICHGVTVLAWARVDGTSPIAGKQVAVPLTVATPNQNYGGDELTYPNYSGQFDQIVANGGIASNVSGSHGTNTSSAVDDVVVDGRIITAENYESSAHFGFVIAREVLANLPDEPAAMVDGELHLNGTAADDVIYIWSNAAANSVSAWMNGVNYGPFVVAPGGRVVVHGGDGNDRIFATDLRIAASIFGEGGHDLITGGSANDSIDGGAGVDRISGGFGDDLLLGGDGNDFLYGQEGNDILLGGAGDDYLEGFDGRDLLIGGLESDNLRGHGGEDLLIGGTTSYDNDAATLAVIRGIWAQPTPTASRIDQLATPTAGIRLRAGDTVHDDFASDVLVGGADNDWLFTLANDLVYSLEAGDHASV